jgi:ATP-dependent Clp protease ATP-binding subunit ClpA
LDEIICFEELGRKAMEQITGLYLAELTRRVQEYGVQLQLPEELAAMICQDIRKKDGARQLRRLVRERVEAPLSGYLLQCGKKPAKLRLRVDNGVLQFQK